ncbi:lipopolysaccharide biosynthesis protein [Nocardia sp. NBC_01327]|uniref:lipopolysaccharide biosynthesis protein n=1 Tax=Nocardia sp. NBC_01327 TaxID=2903593 RepID=UPI002E131597|nr:lipopolysaccharide biosynthesis protein [Nocardia sp. NBC_01327]
MLDRLRARLAADGLLSVLRDVGFVSLGNYGQFLVTAVTVPLTARTLGVGGVGLLAIGMSSYFLGSLLVDLGINTFLAALLDEEGLDELRGSYLAVRASILGVLAVALAAGLSFGAGPHLRMILLGLFVGGFLSMSEDWLLVGQGRFGASTSYQIAGRVVYLGLLVVLLPRLPNPSIVLLCLLLSSTVTVALTWRDALRKYGRPARPVRIAVILRKGGPVLASRLLVTSYGQGTATVYSSVLDAASLGLYSSSDKVVRAVQSLLDPIGLALLPRLARERGDSRFWRHEMRALAACVAVAAVAVAGVWITAPLAVHLIFDDDFRGVVPILRVEVFILLATATTSFITTATLPVRQDTMGIMIGAVIGTAVAATALLITLGTHSVWTLVWGTVAAEFSVAAWYLVRTAQLAARERAQRATVPLG